MIDASWFPLLRNLTIFFASVMLFKYFVFLMIAPFHVVKEQLRTLRVMRAANHRQKTYSPLVTVIVPAWNEEVGILRTVKSVISNVYEKFELIVVNDGSTDKTHHTMENFMAEAKDKRIKYFSKENSGKGSALNFGLSQAKGEIILTVDADSVLHSEAIGNLIRYFADSTIDAAVGNVRVANSNNMIGLLQRLEYLFGFYFKRAHSVMGAEYIFGGACAAFRRSKVFDSLGHFDTSNKTEDIELSMRIRHHGLHSVYAEDVVCFTEGAADISGLLSQRLRWKKGRFDTFIKYRRLFFSLDKRHNRFLSWFILPYAALSELQLLFEPIGIALLVTYSFVSGDYISLALGVSFIFLSYFVTAFFNHRQVDLRLVLLFPLTWPLFYFLVWVEYLALLKSLVMLLRGDDITWQDWQRKGIEINQ